MHFCWGVCAVRHEMEIKGEKKEEGIAFIPAGGGSPLRVPSGCRHRWVRGLVICWPGSRSRPPGAGSAATQLAVRTQLREGSSSSPLPAEGPSRLGGVTSQAGKVQDSVAVLALQCGRHRQRGDGGVAAQQEGGWKSWMWVCCKAC